MKTINLKYGKKLLLSDCDVERVSKLTWYAHESSIRKNHWDVRCHFWDTKECKYKTILIHRFILNAPTEMQVDHINHDVFDNRRENLRICTSQQNAWNRKSKKNESGYIGVSKYGKDRYKARINDGQKQVYLGLFNDLISAAKAYDKKAKELRGDFAVLNFQENQ